MKIAIRLDDITEEMDWEKFLRFKELLCKYELKPLIGVIPCSKDSSLRGSSTGKPSDFWTYIKELQNDGYTVAQHGMYHVYTTKKGGLFPLNRQSEFAGLSYDEQYKLLSEGKAILEGKGIFTDIFMAPAHSYDKNTLKALKAVGINRMTDGFGLAPYEYHGLTFYPISFRRSDTLKNTGEGFSTFVFHTNTMKDSDFTAFEKLLSTRRDIFISYNEYLLAQNTGYSFLDRCSEFMKAYIKRMMVRFL